MHHSSGKNGGRCPLHPRPITPLVTPTASVLELGSHIRAIKDFCSLKILALMYILFVE